MKFWLTQFKFFRKIYGGQWYLISNHVFSPFWTQDKTMANSCGGVILGIEIHR